MIPAEELQQQSLESLEADIAVKRASLDWKVRELERRLDPRERLADATAAVRANAPQYLAWAAVGAVVTGIWLAFRGWRERRSSDLYLSPDHPLLMQDW